MKTVSLLLILGSLALAQTQGSTGTSPDPDFAAHKAKIEKALSDRDFATWKAEHDAFKPNDTRFAGINPDNFDKFARMVEARKMGNKDLARQLRQELALEPGSQGQGKGKGKGKHDGSGQGQKQGSGQGKGRGQQGDCTK